MTFFGNRKSKEDKELDQLNKLVEKYNLGTMNVDDLQILKRITDDLRANGFFKTGMALSFAKSEEQAKIGYLSALVEQNWLIVKQLSEINNKLDKIVKDN